MEDKIEQLKAQAAEAIKNAAGNLSELDDIRVKFLGKKGEFTTILRGMGALAKEDRPKVGKIVNEAKAEIAALIQQKNEELKAREMQARLEREKIDVTLPGRQQPLGHLHPLTLTLERIKDIFFRMGFSVEEGPEIEKDYYNFEGSLTTPPCTEGVNWIVFKNQETVSKEQVEKFTQTLGFENNRPIQDTNGRQIKE